MKTFKTFILTILCIMTIQDCMSVRIICSKDSVCNKSDFYYTTLKECKVSPVLLSLAENFIRRNKKELDHNETIIYMDFRKAYYPYSESLYIYAYPEDPSFYNIYLIGENAVGYFQCCGYYCIIIQQNTARFVDSMYHFTGNERSFLGCPFSSGLWPDEPTIQEMYEYQNNKFVHKK